MYLQGARNEKSRHRVFESENLLKARLSHPVLCRLPAFALVIPLGRKA